MNTKALWFKLIQILSIVFLGGMLYLSYFPSSLLGNSMSIEAVSEKYNTLFTPAPITFTVWSFIYLGLVMYAFWQIKTLFSKDYIHQVDWVVRKIGLLFLVACVFNSLWIVAWRSEKLLISVMLMVGLLITLIKINKRISLQLPATPQYKIYLKIPFGVYLGWISIALIANVAAYLTKIGWDGFGLDPRFWQMAMVLFATLITCWSVFKLNNIAIGLVVLWALGGILIVRINDAIPSLSINLLITLCAFTVLFTILNRTKYWAT